MAEPKKGFRELLEKPDSKAERRKKKAAKATQRKAAMEEAVVLDGVTCQSCGQHDGVSPHHIIYRSQGGPDEIWNLITLCDINFSGAIPCHRKAHLGCDNGSRVSGREFVAALLDRLGGRWGRAKKLLEAKL